MKKYLLALMFAFCLLGVEDLKSQETALSKSNTSPVFSNIPSAIQEKNQSFFQFIEKNEIAKAFDILLDNSPLKNKEEQVKNLIEQTKQSIVLYGKVVANEPVSSEIASSSLIRLRYLGVHTNFPMRWIFTYYNSPKFGWIVINVKLDDMSEYFFSDE